MGTLDNLAPGDLVHVTDSTGTVRTKRAFGPAKQGGTFLVVWACREEEWQAAQLEGRDPEGLPWPAEDVTVPQAAPA